MKTFKKVLGVVLAIAMLAGVFSMMASALAPDSAVDLYISTDKPTYSAGETITITVSQQVEAAVGNMQIAGTYPIGYPSAVLEPISSEKDLELNQGFVAIADGFDNSISGCNFYDDVQAMGVTADAGADWDSVIGIIVASDGVTDFDNTTKKDLFSFQMKIKDTAADGTYTLGFNKDGYVNYYGYSVDTAMGGVYGYDDDYGYGTTANYGFNTCTFTIGAAGPKVNYSKTQLKKNLTMGGETYDVALRIISYITDSDFDTYFANTKQVGVANSETTNKITSVGIVAFDGTAADFDAATAASVVAGTSADGYKYAETDYIQKADDSADATFGAIIRGERAAFENKPVTFMGYVKYLDDAGAEQVIFYEAAVEKTVTTAMLG